MADARARGWGEGWPRDRRAEMVIAGTGNVQVLVHRDIAPLVSWLMLETERRGYRLRRGECWGFANRPITGTRRPSNHSWGLAVDLNAPSNPMFDELITDMPAWMPALWKAWGFGWGGDWQGTKDPMHYEFMGSPDTARTLIDRLANGDHMADDPNTPNIHGPLELHIVVGPDGVCTGYYIFSPDTGELHAHGPGAPFHGRSEDPTPG
jgi:hypothetical protein